MRKFLTSILLVSAAALAACNTVEGVGEDIQSAASALDPTREYPVCGTYGSLDRDNDGWVTSAEWHSYRVGAFPGWDANRDGRIDRTEFGSCWYGGGFYTSYNRADWENNWRAFDANGDGWLSNEEYWSVSAWTRLDRNGDGRIDRNEWRWQ
jgi:predicted small secreted protein